jgi:hypothetical protein
MCVFWYFRDIKINSTFLSFLKLSGGVNLTPYGFLLFHQKASGADGEFFSAWFPISSQRIGGVHERPN